METGSLSQFERRLFLLPVLGLMQLLEFSLRIADQLAAPDCGFSASQNVNMLVVPVSKAHYGILKLLIIFLSKGCWRDQILQVLDLDDIRVVLEQSFVLMLVQFFDIWLSNFFRWFDILLFQVIERLLQLKFRRGSSATRDNFPFLIDQALFDLRQHILRPTWTEALQKSRFFLKVKIHILIVFINRL